MTYYPVIIPLLTKNSHLPHLGNSLSRILDYERGKMKMEEILLEVLFAPLTP